MKQLLLSFLFVGLVIFSFAGNRKSKADNTNTTIISGQVTDQTTGETLVGVKIMLEGTSQVAYTDFDGKYSIEAVKPGSDQLTASYISYEKTTKDIKSGTNKNEVNISLKNSN